MIIGTAGHIDHGKTSLILALTGTNTDRLPEEKKRGITIELGYAYMDVPGSDSRLGFVDVPGHERFVHTMLSGATGIDHALLIVSADDGPMPQTYEHLDILRLLGVQHGTIAVTKIDAVEPGRVDEVALEVAVMVADTMAHHWPVFPVSARSGEGLTYLQDHLFNTAQQHQSPSDHGHFRLAIDRCFVLAGRGTVVTGTAFSGRVSEGEELFMNGRKMPLRVRSIHAEDRPTKMAKAGQRVALNLAGLSHEEVNRGDWLRGCPVREVPRFDALLQTSALEGKDIRSGLEVHLHHGSRDVMARIYPLESSVLESGKQALVSVQTVQPISVCIGDRFVLRDSQARSTIAGGVVLDTQPPSRGKRTTDRLTLLTEISTLPSQETLHRLLRRGPIVEERIRTDWNLTSGQLEDLLQSATLIRAGSEIFHQETWKILQDRALELIGVTHIREPEMPGLELQRLRRQLSPTMSQEAFALLIDQIASTNGLLRRGAFVALPSHRIELEQRDQALWQSIKPLLAHTAFQPPRVRDIAKELNIAENEIRENLRKVARVGDVVLVALDHFFLKTAVSEMAKIVEQIGDGNPHVRAGAFRDQIGGGRKVAIQILEFFDRVGFTRRIKDNHLVRRSNPWSDI